RQRRRSLYSQPMNFIGVITRTAADLVFPPQCALCGAGGTLLCGECAAGLPRAGGRRCECCWMPIHSRGLCRHCLEEPPAFSSLRAAFVMDDGARRLAHELKYEGLTSLARPMASLMLPTDLSGLDVVVPVPLHRGRERSRGYNQAEELAHHLAHDLSLPSEPR